MRFALAERAEIQSHLPECRQTKWRTSFSLLDEALGTLFAFPFAQMPTDATLTIRCPYCMAGIEFKPMVSYKDGRFVCEQCAHTVRPGVPEYRCTCRNCLKMLKLTK